MKACCGRILQWLQQRIHFFLSMMHLLIAMCQMSASHTCQYGHMGVCDHCITDAYVHLDRAVGTTASIEGTAAAQQHPS